LLCSNQGKYAEAEPLYKRALAIKEKTLGPDHPDVATSLHNLAWVYSREGKYKMAEPLYKRALAIKEQALGPNSPDVATGLENYVCLLRKTNRMEEATTMEARQRPSGL
jgi:Tfp pilus assembly protein PilF